MLASEVRYVYDRMLVLQERRADNTVLATYTRGLDLSGSMQGAGGIGGLLARTDSAGSTYYHSDGGGNITSLTDSSGAVVARYLYDPFGQLLGRWGPMAEVNRYQFSSKETDRLTGLSYYGYRFYDPSLQRWLNQDPLGEGGGINLYGFVGNAPFSYVDPNGLFLKDFFAELGQGFYDLMMGHSPGQYDPNTYGRMRADMLGGVDRDNNFLRDLFADTSGTIGDIATDQAASAAGGKLLVGAVCKLAKPVKNLADKLIGESSQLSKPFVQNFAAKGTQNFTQGFSNGNFGNAVHARFRDALTQQTRTRSGDWLMRTRPGQTGVDATYIGPASRNPGFNYAELKPNTPGSVYTLGNQLGNWNLPPGQTELWLYNETGIIGSSGFRF